jgi:hypothetical protein
VSTLRLRRTVAWLCVAALVLALVLALVVAMIAAGGY